MAQIVINEISENYTFNIGTASYATVALPITSCWGPGYFDPETMGNDVTKAEVLEKAKWLKFPATQAGLESFVSTYRGPASSYRMANDYSYQMAVTLLTAGYDVLTCRVSPGQKAGVAFMQDMVVAATQSGTIPTGTVVGACVYVFRAKYPGTFGNKIRISVTQSSYYDGSTQPRQVRKCFNVVTYIVDNSGSQTAVENINVVFDRSQATDYAPYYKEVTSNYWDVIINKSTPPEGATVVYNNFPMYLVSGGSKYNYPYTLDPEEHPTPTVAEIEANLLENMTLKSESDPAQFWGQMSIGSDYDSTKSYSSAASTEISNLSKIRYEWACNYMSGTIDRGSSKIYAYSDYLGDATGQSILANMDQATYAIMYYKEWLFNAVVGDIADGGVLDLLKDKLSYDYNRVISPGWDDQDILMYVDGDRSSLPSTWTVYADQTSTTCQMEVSPLNAKLMDVAYYSRCGTGLIDVPKVLTRKYVHIEDPDNLENQGYIQKLARLFPPSIVLEANGSLFNTNSAFFAPWGQYTYVGTSKMTQASPSFLALMIQRAQILNQAIQYEWALPTNRKQNLRIGKMDYTVPKKILDKWQKIEGASVNVITDIPDLGISLWGNSTLFEVPPSTYQALANLSTRYLVNAVEDCVYRCGLNITFQYNNDQAYNKFYAGVTPLLDTMQNVGAIEGYRVTMSADINGLDHVNANTVIGKIWLVVNGVINDIYVDLIALPAGLGIDLNSLS